MNKYIICLLPIFCFGCEKKTYKTTEFLLRNNCDYTIEVRSTALVRYSDGYEENTLNDLVQSRQLLSMRKIDVSEDFSIEDVFTEIEIYKGPTKSTYDVMNKDNWVQTLTSEDKDEYTLTVDSTFFK